MTGSSPLARGLRRYRSGPVRRRRIIPARAGFTGRCGMSNMILRGSSPLARGLRNARERIRRLPGIIPARAGFTDGGGRPVRAEGDHPRSRGVYQMGMQSRPEMVGSSPLARGLPRRATGMTGPARIIPARAGFTRHAPLGKLRAEDHPRSRGVYPPRRGTRIPADGSSPLARGLRHIRSPNTPGRGIIPARAGFTPLMLLTGRPS